MIVLDCLLRLDFILDQFWEMTAPVLNVHRIKSTRENSTVFKTRGLSSSCRPVASSHDENESVRLTRIVADFKTAKSTPRASRLRVMPKCESYYPWNRVKRSNNQVHTHKRKEQTLNTRRNRAELDQSISFLILKVLQPRK
jgi:hypothetical protein